MSRWPRRMFGVEIIHIRDGDARKVVSILTGGRGVWALLPDGRVGTNDESFFRHAYAENSRAGVYIAERLWRLGKMSKGGYQKLAAAQDKRDKLKDQKSAASDLVFNAKRAGIVLTTDQRAQVRKLGANA